MLYPSPQWWGRSAVSKDRGKMVLGTRDTSMSTQSFWSLSWNQKEASFVCSRLFSRNESEVLLSITYIHTLSHTQIKHLFCTTVQVSHEVSPAQFSKPSHTCRPPPHAGRPSSPRPTVCHVCSGRVTDDTAAEPCEAVSVPLQHDTVL